jgi:hypothetical protein
MSNLWLVHNGTFDGENWKLMVPSQWMNLVIATPEKIGHSSVVILMGRYFFNNLF